MILAHINRISSLYPSCEHSFLHRSFFIYHFHITATCFVVVSVCCGHHISHHRKTELCAFFDLFVHHCPWFLSQALPLVVFWSLCQCWSNVGSATLALHWGMLRAAWMTHRQDKTKKYPKHKCCGANNTKIMQTIPPPSSPPPIGITVKTGTIRYAGTRSVGSE